MQVQFLLILVNYTSNIKLTLRNSKQVAVGEAMVLELSVLLMSQDACMCESGPFFVFYFSQYKMYIQENNNLCQKKKRLCYLSYAAASFPPPPLLRYLYRIHTTKLFYLIYAYF